MSNHKVKILAVDDEPDVLEIIEYNLKNQGYDVTLAHDGEEAVKIAKILKPNLIILDIMMPKLDGIETCKKLRQIESLQDCLVVFLTARSEEFLEIAGFNAGADDYISKPIKPRALISRINAMLRRTTAGKSNNLEPKLEVSDLIIDRETYLVYRDGKEYPLARKEFELIYLLASKPGKVFSRDQILEQVWGNDVVVVNRTIDVHIRKLRKALGEDYISTIKGIGYKFDLHLNDEPKISE